MRILFDMITVCRRTGAGEYVRRVFYALLERQQPADIVCLYDAKRGIAYDDLQPGQLTAKGLTVCDIAGEDLSQLTQRLGVDHVFIGCAQFWWQYRGIEDLRCKVTVVIHDLSHQEKWRNHIDEYNKLRKTSVVTLAYSIWRLRRHKGAEHLIAPFISLAKINPLAQLVVVSDYTRYSLQYLTDAPVREIKVLYSPLRQAPESRPIENARIAELIDSNERFFVTLGTHISLKNCHKAIHAFARYIETGGQGKLLTIGQGIRQEYDCQVTAEFVSDSDLDAVFRHCHALIYPSLFEGFGYPPLEAMRYSKPVLCSNACSMPEVLGDAPIYFSPLYETDIFRALQLFDHTDYATLAARAKRQYIAVSQRQEHDLQALLNLLTH